MRAIQFEEFGSYDTLRLVELPAPRPEPGQVLVRIRLASVTPLDNTVRLGHLPRQSTKRLPLILGTGGVGEVLEPGDSALPVGAPVLVSGWGYGTSRDGTWREVIAVPASDLIPIPDGVSPESVLALSTGAGHLTAYMALTKLVPFAAGQAVLAPGIGGSVGQGSVEVAKALGASLAISTASTSDKAERGRADGYDVIDLAKESLRDGVLRRTGGRGVDVVLDGVAGPFTGEALACLAPGGTLVSVGYSGGMKTTINVTDIIWRTARVVGFMFSMFQPAEIADANRALLDLLARGAFRPAISRTFPLEQAAEAQRYLIGDRPYGRVLLGV